MKANDDMKALLSALTSGMSAEETLLSVLQGVIAGEISMRRQELGLSQKELADRLGVSQGLVSRWERGESNFSLSTLVRISSVLGLSMQSPITPAPPVPYASRKNNVVYLSNQNSWQFSSYKPEAHLHTGIESENELQEM